MIKNNLPAKPEFLLYKTEDGKIATGNATSGTPNTGGGAERNGTTGGSGGSGIVIIRYPN